MWARNPCDTHTWIWSNSRCEKKIFKLNACRWAHTQTKYMFVKQYCIGHTEYHEPKQFTDKKLYNKTLPLAFTWEPFSAGNIF